MTVTEWGCFVQEPDAIPTAMTIGVFDGVHEGHRELIGRVVAKNSGLMPTVVTFKSNPKARVRELACYEGDILSLDQKIDILETLGIRCVVLIDFSGDFSKMSGKVFISLLRERGNMRYLVVGSDFRCGYRLDTDALLLKRINGEYGVETEVVPPKLKGAFPVSSSRIRAAIAAGDLVEASALLGRNVEIDLAGVPTTPGDGRIGFHVRSAHRIAPPDGRYSAILRGRYSASSWKVDVLVSSGIISFPIGTGYAGETGSLRVELLT
jgi:riboflavin kinase/FMN adenylyltransferase